MENFGYLLFPSDLDTNLKKSIQEHFKSHNRNENMQFEEPISQLEPHESYLNLGGMDIENYLRKEHHSVGFETNCEKSPKDSSLLIAKTVSEIYHCNTRSIQLAEEPNIPIKQKQATNNHLITTEYEHSEESMNHSASGCCLSMYDWASKFHFSKEVKKENTISLESKKIAKNLGAAKESMQEEPPSSHLTQESNDDTTKLEIEGLQNNMFTEKLSVASYRPIRVLNLSKSNLTDRSLKLLVESYALEQLSRLNISENNFRGAGARRLGSNNIWKELLWFDLSKNDIGDAGIKHIAANSTWTKLRILNLSNTCISKEGAKALALNESWRELIELYLHENPLGDSGAAALSSNVCWKELQTLALWKCEIGRNGIDCLRRNKIWKKIKVLWLWLDKDSVGDGGVRALSKSRYSRNFEALSLCGNELSDKGLQTLVNYSGWQELQKVYFDRNPTIANRVDGITEKMDEIWNNLAVLRFGSKRMNLDLIGFRTDEKNLDPLEINSAKFTANNLCEKQGLMVVSETLAMQNLQCENNIWSNIRHLNLRYSKIGVQGAFILSHLTAAEALETLDLEGNTIGPQGMASLSINATWRYLQVLNLCNNSIGAEGTHYLSRCTHWPNLKSLDLGYNRLHAEGAFELSKNKSFLKLENLDLRGDAIGDSGLALLCGNTTWKKLKVLNLENNSIGPEGADSLSRNRSWAELSTLFLDYNHIGDQGAEYLRHNLSWTNLKKLSLERNFLSNKGAAELALNKTWTNLQNLNLRNNNIGYQ